MAQLYGAWTAFNFPQHMLHYLLFLQERQNIYPRMPVIWTACPQGSDYIQLQSSDFADCGNNQGL